jgi:gluconokinase
MHAPGVRFVHLKLPESVAQRRVAARTSHFMPPSLVANQFATLEDPAGEPGVVALDATQPLQEVIAAAVRALAFNHP